MTLDELSNYLAINSNQYYIGSENIEVTDDVLQGLSQRGLGIYGNYRPSLILEQININSNPQVFSKINGRDVISIKNLYLINPTLVEKAEPVDFSYKFVKETKTMYTNFFGIYWAEVLVVPILDEISIAEIDFLNIMIALYIKYIASVRKGFTIEGLPFNNDAVELYSQGQELLNNTLQNLESSNSNWYLAVK